MTTTRGEYRPFFGSILDDPDFQAMPGQTFKVLFALKIVLGPAGIGVPRLSALAETVGSSLDELSQNLALLERKKPGEDYGWILRERNIVWLVNGLRHELLKPNNHPHKKRIQSQILALGDKPIVRLFRSYYHEWFDQTTPSIDGPKREPKGSHEGGSRHKSESETKREADETKSETETGGAFLGRFYSGATPERRAEVQAQLTAALSPEGVRVRKGEFVHARSRSHLNRCLEETMRQGVKIDDKAIVVVLRKLGDPEKDSNGDYPIEAKRRADKADQTQSKEYLSQRSDFAQLWANNHPDEMAAIEQLAITAVGPDASVPGYEGLRKLFISQKAAEAGGFPDFETWAAGEATTAVA